MWWMKHDHVMLVQVVVVWECLYMHVDDLVDAT
jgi:hypothetical protein